MKGGKIRADAKGCYLTKKQQRIKILNLSQDNFLLFFSRSHPINLQPASFPHMNEFYCIVKVNIIFLTRLIMYEHINHLFQTVRCQINHLQKWGVYWARSWLQYISSRLYTNQELTDLPVHSMGIIWNIEQVFLGYREDVSSQQNISKASMAGSHIHWFNITGMANS